MNLMRQLLPPHIQNLKAYVPGKPIAETEREYGVTNIAKLASNENCLGASPAAIAAATKALTSVELYPDAGAFYLKQSINEHFSRSGLGPENIVVGNGTNEILTLVVRALVGPGESVLMGWPSFIVYRLAAMGLHRGVHAIPLLADDTYDLEAMAQAARNPENNIKVIFIANPNNPTGTYVGDKALAKFLQDIPEDIAVVLDEAYAEYVDCADYPDSINIALSRPRTIATRTFSKAYGLASLRVGFAIGDVELVSALDRLRDPFNVNTSAQEAAIAALGDQAHVERAKAHNQAGRATLTSSLQELGFTVTPSQCNFVLATLPEACAMTSGELHEFLLRSGVIIRPMGGYGRPDSFRITVGTDEQTARLLAALQKAFAK